MSLKCHYFSITLFVTMCPLLALIWPWAPFGGSSWDHEICRIGSKANMYKYVIPSGNSRVCSRTSLFFIGKSSSFSMGHFPSNKWYSPAFNSSSISCSHPFNYFYGSLPIDHSWKTPYLNIFNGKKTWFPVNFPNKPIHWIMLSPSMDQWINGSTSSACEARISSKSLTAPSCWRPRRGL